MNCYYRNNDAFEEKQIKKWSYWTKMYKVCVIFENVLTGDECSVAFLTRNETDFT